MSSPLSIDQFSKENLVYVHGINEKIATNYIGAIDNTPRYNDATFDYRVYLTKTLNPKSTLDQSLFSIETLYKSKIDAILDDTFKLNVLYDTNRSIEGIYSDLEAVRAMNAIGTFDLSTCFYTTRYTKELPYVSTFDHDSFIEKLNSIEKFDKSSENDDILDEVLFNVESDNAPTVNEITTNIPYEKHATLFEYRFDNSQSFIVTLREKDVKGKYVTRSYYYRNEKSMYTVKINLTDDECSDKYIYNGFSFKKIVKFTDSDTNVDSYYAIVNINGCMDIIVKSDRNDDFVNWSSVNLEENVYLNNFFAKDFKNINEVMDYKAVSLKNIMILNKFDYDDIHFAIYKELSNSNPYDANVLDYICRFMYSLDNKTWYKCDFKDPNSFNSKLFDLREIMFNKYIKIEKMNGKYYLYTMSSGQSVNSDPSVSENKLYEFDFESKKWVSVLKTNKSINKIKEFNNAVYCIGRICTKERQYDSSINDMKEVSVRKNVLIDVTNSKEYEINYSKTGVYISDFTYIGDKFYFVSFDFDNDNLISHSISSAKLDTDSVKLTEFVENVVTDIKDYCIFDNYISYIKNDEDNKMHILSNSSDDIEIAFENEIVIHMSSITNLNNTYLIFSTYNNDTKRKIYYTDSSLIENEVKPVVLSYDILDGTDSNDKYDKSMKCFPYYIGKSYNKFVVMNVSSDDSVSYDICSFEENGSIRLDTTVYSDKVPITLRDPEFWYQKESSDLIIGVDEFRDVYGYLSVNENTLSLNDEHVNQYIHFDLYEYKLYWKNKVYGFYDLNNSAKNVPTEFVCNIDNYFCTKDEIYAIDLKNNKLLDLCNNPFEKEFTKFKSNGVSYVGSYYIGDENNPVVLKCLEYDKFRNLVENTEIENIKYVISSDTLKSENIELEGIKYAPISIFYDYYSSNDIIRLTVMTIDETDETIHQFFSRDGLNFKELDNSTISFTNDLMEFNDSLVSIDTDTHVIDDNFIEQLRYLEKLSFDKDDNLIIDKYDLYMIAGKYVSENIEPPYESYDYVVNTLDVINNSIYVSIVRYDKKIEDHTSKLSKIYILKIDNIDDENTYSVTEIDNVEAKEDENIIHDLIECNNYMVIDEESIMAQNNKTWNFFYIHGINHVRKDEFISDIKNKYLKHYLFNKLIDDRYIKIIDKIVSDFKTISDSYLTFYDMVTKFGITSDKTNASKMVSLYNDIVEMQKYISFVLSSHKFIKESFEIVADLKKKYPNYMNKYFNSEINIIPHMYNILWSIVETRLSKMTSIKQNVELYNYFSKSLIDTNIDELMKNSALLGRHLINPITESSINGAIDESENNIDKIYSVMTQNYDKVKVLLTKYWPNRNNSSVDDDFAKIQNVKFLMYLYISVMVLMVFDVVSSYSSKNNPLGSIDFDTIMQVLRIDYKKTYIDEEILSDQFDKLLNVDSNSDEDTSEPVDIMSDCEI